MCEVHILSPPPRRVLSEFNLRLNVVGHSKDDVLLIYINRILFYEGPVTNVVSLDTLPLSNGEKFLINVAIYDGNTIIATDESGPYKYSNKAEEPLKFTSWGASKLFTDYIPDTDIDIKRFGIITDSVTLNEEVENILILPNNRNKTIVSLSQVSGKVYIVNASTTMVVVNNLEVLGSSEATVVNDGSGWKLL